MLLNKAAQESRVFVVVVVSIGVVAPDESKIDSVVGGTSMKAATPWWQLKLLFEEE